MPTAEPLVPRVSILVATCRRPEGLARLLRSLENLKLEPDLLSALEVVVIDNDPEELGAAVAREFAAGEYRWPLRCLVETRPGISEARNRALTAADRPTFVAFVDDDEYVSADWLRELLLVQRETDADAVLGPVLPDLPPTSPEWLRSGGFFERARYQDRAEVAIFRTGNVLVRWEALSKLAEPRFNPAFSVTGGGDTELGMRLNRLGAHFRWADRAEVWETVPPDRARAAWLMRRWFRLGVSLSRAEISVDPRWKTLANRAAKGLGRVLIGGLLLPPSIAFGRVSTFRRIQMIAFGAGMVAGLVGLKYGEYRRKPTSADSRRR